MSVDVQALATALQIGDSQFPSGGFAFSWGLEGIWRQGLLTRDRLPRLLAAQLEGRWAPFDRVVVARAQGAWSDVEALRQVDLEVEAMSWSEALRDGSRRAGRALLATHARLGTPGAADYRNRIDDGAGLGHLPVAQGLVFGASGLDLPTGLTLSAMGFLSGLGSVAIRLGIVGAIDVQKAVADLRPRIAALAIETPPTRPSSFAPLAEIAMMRHAAGGAMLFSN